jgi:hypothetical protein
VEHAREVDMTRADALDEERRSEREDRRQDEREGDPIATHDVPIGAQTPLP